MYICISYFIDDESEFTYINKIAATEKKSINSTFLICVDAYLQYRESYFILLNIFGGNICRKWIKEVSFMKWKPALRMNPILFWFASNFDIHQFQNSLSTPYELRVIWICTHYTNIIIRLNIRIDVIFYFSHVADCVR